MTTTTTDTSHVAATVMLGRLEASIMAESALVDKESGRVFWEGGSSSTLSASLYPKLNAGELMGLSHFKATLLTIGLLVIVFSLIAEWVRTNRAVSTATTSNRLSSFGNILLQWTLLQTPKVGVRFVVTTIILYLLEAYTCSTHRFLKNAISSQTELEDFLEELRQTPPVVTWKVRCFHYEKPFWLAPIQTMQRLFSGQYNATENSAVTSTRGVSSTFGSNKASNNLPALLRRKVVSHQATDNYTFGSCVDDTTAGVWNLASSAQASPSPFMKIVLSKILVLANEQARKDYFRQQAQFVTTEGTKDQFAEYSTSIEVSGFRRRMLAIRPIEGVPSAKLFRLHTFWIFTLFGLSLPYRIWFSYHCDQLRVTIVKETSAPESAATKSTLMSSWLSMAKSPAPVSSTTSIETKAERFRTLMEDLMLYAKQDEKQVADSATILSQREATTLPVTTGKCVTDSKIVGKANETIDVDHKGALLSTQPTGLKDIAVSESSSPTTNKNTTNADNDV